ncbi:MAG: amidohydrolase family protein [Myxococcaceae bacterium]
MNGANPVGSDELLPACIPSCAAAKWHESWRLPMPAVHDEEGPRLPTSLPEVIDGHVHLFPDRMFEAIWKWFDNYGWPVRYKLKTPEVIRFLLSRGVSRIVALHYAHKEGIARTMNRFMAEVVRAEPRVTGVATVMPGEADARGILEEGFSLGLTGVKLHCHVQSFSPDDPRLHPVYETCSDHAQPIVIHAGREPSSPEYPVDPYTLCSVDRIEAVLRSFPKLRICVPHLGADEFDGYLRLLERYDNLYLDTTMTLGSYFPGDVPWRMVHARPDRILYGTDFPNLPYAWDREVRAIAAQKFPEEALASVLGETAKALFAPQRAAKETV